MLWEKYFRGFIPSTIIQFLCCSAPREMSAFPAPVVHKPSSKHTATVIFLHGLGDTGHGWMAGFEEILPKHVKYIGPNAKTMRVTLNMGMQMPSWFDIYGLQPDAPEDQVNIKASADYLTSLVKKEEESGIPTNRIVIGGFSQGGAVALYNTWSTQHNYAGVIGLSTWMPLHKAFLSEVKPSITNKDIPILLGHGNADPLVDYEKMGRQTFGLLKTVYSATDFKTYSRMGHSSCPEEMNDVKEFIMRVLPEN
ncbi:acyl-protein thioesterase 1 isoform X2 [Nematostella vectensis]|uniref:acyl-protein thioesterase 1 isoform X2 n=1 Tax=Nematostella vectensis TaxID=45351 RepID=UPI00139037B1|nr:acyl-protein thioesterase 1 isoform X2 [Nematostella vectensis]